MDNAVVLAWLLLDQKEFDLVLFFLQVIVIIIRLNR